MARREVAARPSAGPQASSSVRLAGAGGRGLGGSGGRRTGRRRNCHRNGCPRDHPQGSRFLTPHCRAALPRFAPRATSLIVREAACAPCVTAGPSRCSPACAPPKASPSPYSPSSACRATQHPACAFKRYACSESLTSLSQGPVSAPKLGVCRFVLDTWLNLDWFAAQLWAWCKAVSG